MWTAKTLWSAIVRNALPTHLTMIVSAYVQKSSSENVDFLTFVVFSLSHKMHCKVFSKPTNLLYTVLKILLVMVN